MSGIGPGIGCEPHKSPPKEPDIERCPAGYRRGKRNYGNDVSKRGRCRSDAGPNTDQPVATTYGTEIGIGDGGTSILPSIDTSASKMGAILTLSETSESSDWTTYK